VEGSNIEQSLQLKTISIVANNSTSTDGQVVVDQQSTHLVKVLVDFDSEEYYEQVANYLSKRERSAVIGSFAEQRVSWSRQPENSRV
jgi:dihydrodipicolinate reductase